MLSHASSLRCPSRFHGLPQVQVCCLLGFPHYDLDWSSLLIKSLHPLFNWIPEVQASAWLWNSATASIRYRMKALWQLRQSSVWLQEKASSGMLSTIARSLSILVGSGSLPGTSQWHPLSRYLLHHSRTQSHLQLNHPDPSCSHPTSPSVYCPTSSLPRTFHLLPLPREVHVFLLKSSLLPSSSGVDACSLVILCFPSNIPLGVSTCFVCLDNTFILTIKASDEKCNLGCLTHCNCWTVNLCSV